jgi:hypothetical protein
MEEPAQRSIPCKDWDKKREPSRARVRANILVDARNNQTRGCGQLFPVIDKKKPAAVSVIG